MSDWLDIEPDSPGTAVVVAAEPGDPIARVRAFDKAWGELTQKQKTFLVEWKDARFNVSRARRNNPSAVPNQSTVWHWKQKEPFAFAMKIMQIDATKDVLEKERLILRQDDCAEQLLEPKPILYQGAPTGFFESEPAAAAKVNEVLLRVGGHLRDEQASAPAGGPALIVQVTSKIGEMVTQTTIGVVPEAPPPDEAWLSIHSGQ